MATSFSRQLAVSATAAIVLEMEQATSAGVVWGRCLKSKMGFLAILSAFEELLEEAM